METNTVVSMLVIGFSLTQVLFGQLVTNHNAIYQGDATKPLPGVQFTDPNFHTPVTRLTDARTAGIHGLAPDYSKRQAWNSDESFMMLRSGWGETYLYNGQNYQFLKILQGASGEDVFWHPSKPNIILYNPDSVLYSYNVAADEVTKIHSFVPFNYANTSEEGNMSNDGRYYAVAERIYNFSTGEVSYHDLSVYDFQEDRIVSTLLLPQGQISDFDWVSISPLGNYVVVDYADWETGRYHGVEVYDRNLNLKWQKGLGPGHSDLGLDATGQEVLIMDVYKDIDNLTHICKFALATGDSTHLLSVSPFFDLHESCRAMSRPGWVYISTFDYVERLTDSNADWLPFEDEVFALKMDGSGSVERYAHHHSRRYSPSHADSDNSIYIAEPHATVSRSGNRILFGSNWRTVIGEDFSVDTYLVDLRNMITGTREDEVDQAEVSFRIYPNPVSDNLIILSAKDAGEYRIKIYDPIGKIVKEFFVNQSLANLDVTTLPAGLFYYQIADKNGTPQDRGKFIKQ